MTELANQEELSALLKLDPEKVCYASSNRAVGQWNLLVIDKLVKSAVDHIPKKLTQGDVQEYCLLRERLKKISQQFRMYDYDDVPLARHIESLSQKLDPFKRVLHPFLEGAFKHVLSKKIFELNLSDLERNQARAFICDLINFFDRLLIPAMSHLKTIEDRDTMRILLKRIVELKTELDPLDFEGLLEAKVILLVKHFLFNAVVSDRIYHNLLHYQEGSLDLSDLSLCKQAAESINTYMLDKLIPFIEDPEITPSREEIIKIFWNLSTLNQELIAKHSKEGALLFQSLQVIEKII